MSDIAESAKWTMRDSGVAAEYRSPHEGIAKRNVLFVTYVAAFLTLGVFLTLHCGLSMVLGVMMFVNIMLAIITLYVLRATSSEAKLLNWLFFGCFNFLAIVGLIGSSCPRF